MKICWLKHWIKKYCLLTEVELRRNRFGDSYTLSIVKLTMEVSTGQPRQLHLSHSEESRVKMTIQNWETFQERIEKRLWYLVHFSDSEGPPSFPSLRTFTTSSALQHLDVQVFPGQASKSMTLALVITDAHVDRSIMEAFWCVCGWKCPHWIGLICWKPKLLPLLTGTSLHPRNPNSPINLTAITSKIRWSWCSRLRATYGKNWGDLFAKDKESYWLVESAIGCSPPLLLENG